MMIGRYLLSARSLIATIVGAFLFGFAAGKFMPPPGLDFDRDEALPYGHQRQVVPRHAPVIQQRYQSAHRDSDKCSERQQDGDGRQIRFDGAPELAQFDFLLWASCAQRERAAGARNVRSANHKPTTGRDLPQEAA